MKPLHMRPPQQALDRILGQSMWPHKWNQRRHFMARDDVVMSDLSGYKVVLPFPLIWTSN